MIIPEKKIVSHLKNVRGAIHVGAHTREEEPFYAKLSIPVVWIEAEDGVAISSRNGNCDFYRASNGASSSILKPKEHLRKHPKITFSKPVQIKCMTLDSYLEHFQVKKEYYNFLNIDVQGAELEVLKGADLDPIDYIYTEVNTEELYEGCAMLDEMDMFLSKFDRVETFIYSQYGWGDALYVRKS